MSTLNLALGSTSLDKKRILKEALSLFSLTAEIRTVDVSPGINEQPLNEKTTIKGAENRAIAAMNAFHKGKKIDFAVGLEGGLCWINNKGYFLICAAVICDKDKITYLGLSSKLQLPKEVSDEIKKGKSFGKAIRDFHQKNKNNSSLIKIVNLLISRKEAFREAITNAFLIYANKIYY